MIQVTRPTGPNPFDRYRPNREIRRAPLFHLHQHAIVERRTRTKTTLLIIAHQHELLDPMLLRRRQNVPAYANPLPVERFNAARQHRPLEPLTDRHLEPQIIERLVVRLISGAL